MQPTQMPYRCSDYLMGVLILPNLYNGLPDCSLRWMSARSCSVCMEAGKTIKSIRLLQPAPLSLQGTPKAWAPPNSVAEQTASHVACSLPAATSTSSQRSRSQTMQLTHAFLAILGHVVGMYIQSLAELKQREQIRTSHLTC